MRLGLIPIDPSATQLSVGRFYGALALAQHLESHEITWLTAEQVLDQRASARARFDAFLLNLAHPGGPELAIVGAPVVTFFSDEDLPNDSRIDRATTCPSLLLRETSLVGIGARRVFCAATLREHRELLTELYRRMARTVPTLFVAHTSSDLEYGAPVGSASFYYPYHPLAYAKAICSASAVITLRWQAALVAVGNGIPTVFLGNNETSLSRARSLHIPCVDLRLVSTADECLSLIEQGLVAYPQCAVTESVRERRRSLDAFLRQHDLLPKRPRKQNARPSEKALTVACITDLAYVPFLLGLIQNLRAVHSGPLEFHVLTLDSAARKFLEANLPTVVCYVLDDIWQPEERSTLDSRSTSLKAYSCKPRFLGKVVRETKGAVLYLDLDILFEESPAYLEKELKEKSVLLFPQWHRHWKGDRTYGSVNGGMILAKRGAEKFLEWWAQMCLERCQYSLDIGAFYTDQGYLDLAPLFFDEVGVYRRADHDIAAWNFNLLQIKREPARPWRALRFGDVPIKSVHAALPDYLCLNEGKLAWDQLASFFSAFPTDQSKPMLDMLLDQQRLYRLPLQRLLNINYILGKSRLDWLRLPSHPEAARHLLHGPGRRLIDKVAPFYHVWRNTRSRVHRLARRFRKPSPNEGPVPDNPAWMALHRQTVAPEKPLRP